MVPPENPRLGFKWFNDRGKSGLWARWPGGGNLAGPGRAG